MGIEEAAAGLIAAVHKADIAEVIAQFPDGDEIGLRTNWQELKFHLSKRLIKGGYERAGLLIKEIDELKAKLKDELALYAKYRGQGVLALSAYDVCISSGNDPLGALRMALRLVSAHISYWRSLIANLELELAFLNEAQQAETSKQMGLFD